MCHITKLHAFLHKISTFIYFYTKKLYLISTIFSQQMLSDRLLLAVTGKQSNNFSSEFKLEPITTYHLKFVIKLL